MKMNAILEVIIVYEKTLQFSYQRAEDCCWSNSPDPDVVRTILDALDRQFARYEEAVIKFCSFDSSYQQFLKSRNNAEMTWKRGHGSGCC